MTLGHDVFKIRMGFHLKTGKYLWVYDGNSFLLKGLVSGLLFCGFGSNRESMTHGLGINSSHGARFLVIVSLGCGS